MKEVSAESFLFLGHTLLGIKSLSKIAIGFLALFLFTLPLFSFAQSDYTLGNTPYYSQYKCGDPGTECGSVQSYNFSSAPQSYSFTQMASVAAAFSTNVPDPVVSPQVDNTPELPKTGGGGRTSEGKLQTSPFFSFSVAALILVSIAFFSKVVSANDNF
ncbi:MAG: hypothetical protein Q7S86_01720 [bacterium]|nr:hypothetical protein [bacterium]